MARYIILELSEQFYIKDVDENRIVSGLLSKKDAKKKLQVLELTHLMDDIIEKNGSLGLPPVINYPSKF